MIMAPVLLAASFAIALLLPLWFSIILGGYFLTTVAYTLDLKKRTIVDVLTLAILYTYRLLAGGAATGIDLSTWLLAFALFLFLSLALVKRYSELDALARAGDTKVKGRGYRVTTCRSSKASALQVAIWLSSCWPCTSAVPTSGFTTPRRDSVGPLHPAALLDLADVDADPPRQDASGSRRVRPDGPDQSAGRRPVRRSHRHGDEGL